MADAFDIAPDALPENACMDTVAQWDSLGHLTMIAAVEVRFGIAFTHREMVELLDEQILVDAIAAKAEAEATAVGHA